MDKQELVLRLQDLKKQMTFNFQKFFGHVFILEILLEEEHFFPELIKKELDALEALLNHAI